MFYSVRVRGGRTYFLVKDPDFCKDYDNLEYVLGGAAAKAEAAFLEEESEVEKQDSDVKLTEENEVEKQHSPKLTAPTNEMQHSPKLVAEPAPNTPTKPVVRSKQKSSKNAANKRQQRNKRRTKN